MAKKNNFSIPVKELAAPIKSALEYAKESEKTKQAQLKAHVQITNSNNDLKKAEMSFQVDREKNYTEMMRVILEHEKECNSLQLNAIIETIRTYGDIVKHDSDAKIKDRCLDEMEKLRQAIGVIDNEEVTKYTDKWLNSVKLAIEE